MKTIRELKSIASRNVKSNMVRAISMVFVLLFSAFLVGILDQLFVVGLRILLGQNSYNKIISMSLSLLISLTLTVPLWVNIKKWYVGLNTSQQTGVASLSMISGCYFKTVGYGIVKTIMLWLLLAIGFIPGVLLLGIVRYMRNAGDNTVLLGVMMILGIIFFVIGAIYAVYFLLGAFYADYVYIASITKNPIKVVITSFKIAKGNRVKILALVVSLAPYLLLSVLVVPVVFTIPYINCTTALFAKQEIEIYQQNK